MRWTGANWKGFGNPCWTRFVLSRLRSRTGDEKMVIRETQMNAFGEMMRTRFEGEMVEYLRENFPAQTRDLTDTQCRALVRHAVTKSSLYGIELEDDIARYLDYVVLYGRDFDTDPAFAWTARILQAEGINGTQKMDRIDAYDQFVMNRPTS